jgi:hypothetical protein
MLKGQTAEIPVMGRAASAVVKLTQVSVLLVLGYFTISAALGLMLGVKLPQPSPTHGPMPTVLADPQAGKPYRVPVDPGRIQQLLNKHPYGRLYKAGVFDCSDMSRETARFLQAEGYHTAVIGDDRNSKAKTGHAWAFVWASKNTGWAIETAGMESQARGSAGEVVSDDWWDLSLPFLQDKSNFFRYLSAGHGYEFYYPSKPRSTLHVLRWNDPKLNGA